MSWLPVDFAELPIPQPDPETVRQRADEILRQPAYRNEPGLLQRVLEWILDRLDDLFPDNLVSSGIGGGGSSMVGWVVIALLVGLAIFIFAKFWRAPRRRRHDDDPLTVTELEMVLSPDQWIEQALRDERAGNWKSALRCRFRSLLVELIERGVLRDLAGRTSGEFRVELRAVEPSASAAFNAASGLFDAAWYGDEPTGPDENAQFRGWAAEVLSATAERHEKRAGPPADDGGLPPLVPTAAAVRAGATENGEAP